MKELEEYNKAKEDVVEISHTGSVHLHYDTFGYNTPEDSRKHLSRERPFTVKQCTGDASVFCNSDGDCGSNGPCIATKWSKQHYKNGQFTKPDKNPRQPSADRDIAETTSDVLTMKRYATDTYGQGETVVSSLQSNEAFVANKFTMWNQRVRVCKFDSRDAAIDATENPYAGNAYDDTNTGTSVGCDRADDANVYMLVADGKPFQYPKDYFKVQSCKYNKLEALKECLEKDKGACRNTATPPRYRSDTNEYRAKMQLNIFAPRTDGLSSDASLCPDVYNDALTSNAFYLPSDDTGLVGTCNIVFSLFTLQNINRRHL